MGSSSSSSSSSSSGIGGGFLGLLTLLFVALKLLGKIDWSWWWVFSPILFGFTFAILFLVVLLIIAIKYG